MVMDNHKKRAVVAMSGGVDSSVAAGLLVQAGYDVTGIMLRLWSEEGSDRENRCCAPDAVALARRVAQKLGIPFYVVDAKEAFRNQVVEAFIQGYRDGITPNPCLTCNRQIRWKFLLERVQAMGAELLATGHYARLRRDTDGQTHLLQGLDTNKDQTYALSFLEQEQLAHTLYPVGDYTKPQVRDLARQMGLPSANRDESQDLCFIAGHDYHGFLRQEAPATSQPGEIVNRQGERLGTHTGLAFYTIGQRKGLGIAAPEALYVLEKELAANRLVVGRQEELGQSRLVAARANWVLGLAPDRPFTAQVKIRYKAVPAQGLVTPLEGGRFSVDFEEPMRDITPGQAAVLYNGDECLGAGIIEV